MPLSARHSTEPCPNPTGAATSGTPVFPALANHYGTLFAGEALNLMARSAVLAAGERAGGDVVMAGCDQIAFHAPVRVGAVLWLTAVIGQVGRTSLTVNVSGVAAGLSRVNPAPVMEGVFHMVAVDAAGRPQRLPQDDRNDPA